MTANDRDAARGATESDVPCCEVVGEGSDVQEAREARYAEAITAVGRGLGWNDFYDEDAACAARAVLTVADAEQAGLRHNVAALMESLQRVAAEREAFKDERNEARAEVERLEDNLSALLCELTGGRLSKTTYDVRTMAREIEAYFQETDDDDLKSAEAALVSEREAHAGLRARVEAVLADRDHSDTCSDALSPDAGYPCTCFRADLRAALAAEPAAPVAAEEGGEQEAGEVERLFFVDATTGERCPTLDNRLCTITDRSHRHRDGRPAPSGSDEQGDRPAIPDANGVHDAKGGATRHYHSRKAMECTHVAGDCCIECCDPGGVRE